MSETIQCGEHGEASATYVCEHLVKKPKQEWFGGWPEEDDPWPDAWCSKCNAAFEREGEWNERNEDEAKIKLLCCGCYEQARGESVGWLSGRPRRAWDDFVAERCRALEQLQDEAVERFGLDRHERWSADLEKGELLFSDGGVPAIRARVEVIGTFSRISNTWLWGWANFHIPEPVRQAVAAVRDEGRERHFPHLTVPKWPCDEHDAWHMTAVAAELMGVPAVYRAPGEKVDTFLAILEVQKLPRPAAS